MSLIPPYPKMERHVRKTRMVMVWESVWPCLIPPLSIGLLFAGLTLTGAFEILPATGHIILVVAPFGGDNDLGDRTVAAFQKADPT